MPGQPVIEIPGVVRHLLAQPVRTDERFAVALEFHFRDDQAFVVAVKHVDFKHVLADRNSIASLLHAPVHANVGEHFFAVYGGDSFPEAKPHPMAIEKLLEESGVTRERALLVGDSAADVLTARNAGILVCGVTYGLHPDKLRRAAPDMLVDRMETVADLVLG